MKSNFDGTRGASQVRQIRGVMLAAALCIASFAVAQEARQPTKAEVESLVVGKKIQYVSTTTGATIGWDSSSS